MFKGCHLTAWDDLGYAYYVKDFRNFRYWIISPTPLDKKQISRVLYFSHSPYGSYGEKIHLIPLAHVNADKELKAMLEEKTPYIEYVYEHPRRY